MSKVLERYGSFVERIFKELPRLVRRYCEESVQEVIEYHLRTMKTSKGMRPALVAAAARMAGQPVSDVLIQRGCAVEAIHRASLIIDDMIDNSGERNGQPSLFTEYSHVEAGVAAAELNLLAEYLLDDSAYHRTLLRQTGHRVGVAEVDQFRRQGRHELLPISAWISIAEGDTGAFFDFALGLGGGPTILRQTVTERRALAVLRHGLDDVEDLTDDGENDFADVRDEVPTLLTCFTKVRTLTGLRKAAPAALAFLADQLVTTANEDLAPFFADFRVKYEELRDRRWVHY